MLHKNHEEIKALCLEVKALSDYIGGLRRKLHVMVEKKEKRVLREDIKQRQYQVLFYIDKMKNI